MMRPSGGHEGTCMDCKRRRVVWSITRHGGGTYRRPGRHYRTSICGDCVLDYAPSAIPGTGHMLTARYDRGRLLNLAAELTGVYAYGTTSRIIR